MSDQDVAKRLAQSVRIRKLNHLHQETLQLMQQSESKLVEALEAVNDIAKQADGVVGNNITDQPHGARELRMAAHLIKMCCDVVHTVSQSMGTDGFNDKEVVAAEKTNLNQPKNPETGFGQAKKPKSTFGQAKKSKIDFDQATKPETVVKLQRKEKSAEVLNLIFNQIQALYEQRRKPIPYYQLIIDPEDFINTVDNAYQISVLIRDGRIALLTDKNHDPIVRPTTEQENEQAKRMNETTQAILGLNPRKWREMIERFQIDEPMLFLNRE